MVKTKSKVINSEKIIKQVTIYAAYLLLVWGFYRVLFKFPDNIEEIFFKPVIWLVPLFFILHKESQILKQKISLASLGITIKNLFPAIYLSLGLGLVFALEAVYINYLKYKSFNFGAYIGPLGFLPSLGISFATAISEEVAFRGYIFNRLWQITKSELSANLISSVVWALIHVPISIFVWKLDFVSALIYLGLTALFGIGSAFVFARTKNVASSILLHVLWEWPLILFR